MLIYEPLRAFIRNLLYICSIVCHNLLFNSTERATKHLMATDLTQHDEVSLVERLREPSLCRAAFNEVITTYSEPLYRQIRRLVQDHDDAADLLQNTFLKAWQSLELFRGDAKLSTWLYKIAVNESLSFLARERKRNNLSLDDQESALANTIEADAYFDGDKLQAMLRKAVVTLPEKQRVVFNMKYFDEMKYEDMSAILGTSVGALKASYHLAVKKIEKYFEENE